MHELIAYLLGGLEIDEQKQVEELLQSDLNARECCELLREGLSVFEFSAFHVEVPSGLAEQTCQRIQQATTGVDPA